MGLQDLTAGCLPLLQKKHPIAGWLVSAIFHKITPLKYSESMKPVLKTLEETKLIGISLRMSFDNNKTKDLWKSFMQRRSEIQNSTGHELYSLEIYDSKFFDHFNPTNEFEKWAAIKVSDFDNVPASMNTLIVPRGRYAVFHYTGKPSQASGTYQFIYNQWIPNSEYALDERPHFTVMGENYKGEHPDSEEELWIPIKPK